MGAEFEKVLGISGGDYSKNVKVENMLYMFCYILSDKVLLHSPGWLQTQDPSASPS
jgi:hypothetical protein